MKPFVLSALLSVLLALGLSACQQQADPRIPELERQLDAPLFARERRLRAFCSDEAHSGVGPLGHADCAAFQDPKVPRPECPCTDEPHP